MKPYKFYNQTAKKTISVFESVSLSFDYSYNHKDNVYFGFNLYTSNYDDPIILNVLEDINSSASNEYGVGSSFYLDYSITVSGDQQQVTLTYPNGETELFEYNASSGKYISSNSTHSLIVDGSKFTFYLGDLIIHYDYNLSKITKYEFESGNKSYDITYNELTNQYSNVLNEEVEMIYNE